MKGVYAQKNSPYYWLRYYDILEPLPNKKRKSLNTKIKITPADLKRISDSRNNGHRAELQGTPDLRKLVKQFKTGLAQRNIEAKSGVKLVKKLKFSEGFEEFVKERTVPGSKKFLKEKTLTNYRLIVNHFIDCCGDLPIYKYNENHYTKLLYYFEEKNLSKNSRSIYTRSLHALWNFFIKKLYTNKNIIESLDPEEKDPAPIPYEDMYTIIKSLRKDKNYPHHYWIVYFMLLTGCRPSSAIVQEKEDIDFKRKQITIRNIKAGERKNKNYYLFPLYKELENLLKEMNVKYGDTGRLFDMYTVADGNYTWSLSFWKRKIKSLVKSKKISNQYTLKQIRPTLASFLINFLNMDIFSVKKLLDHANIKVTDKYYVDFNVNKTRKDLDAITIEGFLNSEF